MVVIVRFILIIAITGTSISIAQPEDIAIEEPGEDENLSAALSAKTIGRYKVGKIQKTRMLREQKRKFRKQGFRGSQLANKMKGAKIGIEMGLQTMAFTIDLKDNGFLLIIKSDETNAMKYKIKRNVLYILNKKTGDYKRFGKFKKRRSILALFDSFVFEKY